jgi:polysaccharide pyruvyl transferase WcaK-like protein
MKKILITYIYGPANAGDMALNLGAIDLLNSIGDFEITGISRFAQNHPDYQNTCKYLLGHYDNLNVIPFPVDYDRNTQSFFSRVMSYIQGINLIKPSLLRNSYWDSLFNTIDTSDYIFFNGGNMLFCRSFKDLPRLAGILTPLKIASSKNKDFAFLPQSIPNLNWAGKIICKKIFQRSKFFLFRDSVSEEQYNAITPNSSLSLDLAFFINQINSKESTKILADKKLESKKFVPIIVRGTTLGDQSDLEQKDITKSILIVEKTINKCQNLNLQPVLVVQTRKDLRLSKEVLSKTKDFGWKVPLIEEYDPLTLRGLYKEAAFVVSMRLHAAIFALSVGTLCLCLYKKEWGPKASGIYEQLSIQHLVKDIDNLTSDELISQIHRLNKKDQFRFEEEFLLKLNVWKDKSLSIVKRVLLNQHI